jgi:hypothetical protein
MTVSSPFWLGYAEENHKKNWDKSACGPLPLGATAFLLEEFCFARFSLQVLLPVARLEGARHQQLNDCSGWVRNVKMKQTWFAQALNLEMPNKSGLQNGDNKMETVWIRQTAILLLWSGCIADSAMLRSHDDLVQACKDAGGMSLFGDAMIACNVSIGNQMGQDIVTAINLPECVAPSYVHLRNWKKKQPARYWMNPPRIEPCLSCQINMTM